MSIEQIGSTSAIPDFGANARDPFQRNLPFLLDDAARRYGAKEFFSIGGETISFSQARDAAARFAGALKERGIEPGDRVAIMCRNQLEFPVMLIGCMWLGAVAVAINTAARGAQLSNSLSITDSRMLVLDPEFLPQFEFIARPQCLGWVWLTGTNGTWMEIGVGDVATAEPLPLRKIGPGEPAGIIFTSGTTGPSKGVICPAAQFYWWAAYQSRAMNVTEGSVIFNVLPLFHINAIASMTQALLAGAKLVSAVRFSASRYWQDVIDAGATHGALVAAMVNILLLQPESGLDRAHSIRTVIGATIRADAWIEFSKRFNISKRVVGYGSTETNAVFNSETGWDQPGNMGFVVDGMEAAIVDEHDDRCADGTAGELVLRSNVPFAFALGYFNMPNATVGAWRNLWFHTGDKVVRDGVGRFRFVGRLKESIRRRGENISAWEVEQALLSHPAVAEAAAYGVDSPMAEEEVMVSLVLREGKTVLPADIAEHLEPRLARYAIPRYIDIVQQLPLTETGKIKRDELKLRGATVTTWDRLG